MNQAAEHEPQAENWITDLERTLTWEKALLILAFGLGLAVRMINLGATPLSDGEAAWAMQALTAARGTATVAGTTFGAQPAYFILSGLIFALAGTNELLARFWPALAGSLLVLLPAILRKDLFSDRYDPPGARGLARSAMLVMTFGLALDPGLVTVSRQAGGPMPALACTLLALALWRVRKPALAGFVGGLALLSGPAVIFGVLGLGLAWFLIRLLYHTRLEQGSSPDETTRPRALTALLALGLTVLLVGSFAFRVPQGLSAWMQALPDFLNGWLHASETSPLTILAALLIFQPFALLFTGVWVIGARRYSPAAPTAIAPAALAIIWALASLALTLVYPGRQVNDLVWTLVPLWLAAGYGLAPYLPTTEQPASHADRVMVALSAIMIVVLAVLFWNTLIAVSNQVEVVAGVDWNLIRAGVLVGILFLGLLTITLVGMGWSWETGRDGLIWGLIAVCLVYSVNLTWSAAQLRLNQPSELWAPSPAAGQTRLLEQTLRDLSNRNTGLPDNLDVLYTVNSPALRWSLRNFAKARFVQELPPGQKPAIAITASDAPQPALSEAYRGQDFVWWVRPGWQGALPPDFVPWLAFHQAPVVNQSIILWARSDMFPAGGSAAPAASPSTP